MLEIKDSVAVITGGGGGIGLAIAKHWVENGGKVVIADVAEAMLKQAETELEIQKAAPSTDVIADLLEDERRLERPREDFVTPELLAAMLDQMKATTETATSEQDR